MPRKRKAPKTRRAPAGFRVGTLELMLRCTSAEPGFESFGVPASASASLWAELRGAAIAGWRELPPFDPDRLPWTLKYERQPGESALDAARRLGLPIEKTDPPKEYR